MVSVPELWAKFGPPKEVEPWGECIIIQGDEFDPDWEAELADQGYNCHEGIQDDYPVMYIQLTPAAPKIPEFAVSSKVQSNEVKEMEKKVEVKVRGRGWKTGPDWTQAQIDLLTACWENLKELPKETRAAQLAKMPEFSGRSANAIYQKVFKLQASKDVKSIFQGEQFPAVKVDVCAENISVLEEIPVESLPKIDGADAFIALVAKTQVLSEVYESHSKAYVDLRTQFENMQKAMMQLGMKVETTDAECRKHVTNLLTLVNRTSDLIIKHKHAVSGEAMIPLEAS